MILKNTMINPGNACGHKEFPCILNTFHSAEPLKDNTKLLLLLEIISFLVFFQLSCQRPFQMKMTTSHWIHTLPSLSKLYAVRKDSPAQTVASQSQPSFTQMYRNQDPRRQAQEWTMRVGTKEMRWVTQEDCKGGPEGQVSWWDPRRWGGGPERKRAAGT